MVLDELRSSSSKTAFIQDGKDYQDVPLDWMFRPNIPRVWTVDFDQSRILLDRHDFHLVYHFNVPDQEKLNVFRMPHYEPLDLPTRIPKQALKPSSWVPLDVIPEQLNDLVYRIVSDYHHAFLDSGDNLSSEQGFQRLSLGILSCFTLNFSTQIREPAQFDASTTTLIHKTYSRDYCRWRSWGMPPVVLTVNLGSTVIIFTQRIDNAATLVQDHYLEIMSGSTSTITYVVCSLFEVQLFLRNDKVFESTIVSMFLYSSHSPPSTTAVRWILNAIHGSYYPLRTRLHGLPVELQEQVLDFVSVCEIDRAYYASILNIGISFDWKSNKMHLKLLKKSNMNRHINAVHAEQMVIFHDQYVGVAYQPDRRKTGECKWSRKHCCLPFEENEHHTLPDRSESRRNAGLTT